MIAKIGKRKPNGDSPRIGCRVFSENCIGEREVGGPAGNTFLIIADMSVDNCVLEPLPSRERLRIY